MAFTDGLKKTAAADWGGIAKNVKSVGGAALKKPKVRLGLGLAGAGAAGFAAGRATSPTEKTAKDENTHQIRRAVLGNSISSAISAKKGKKWEAFKGAYKHDLKSRVKGLVSGGGAGAVVGSLAGAALTKGRRREGARLGALYGAAGGAAVGNAYGTVKGTHGAEATKLHEKYAK